MIPPSPSGSVYGVVLNDHDSLRRFAPELEHGPYKAAPAAPVLYIKPANTRAAHGARIALPGGAERVEVSAAVGLVMGRAAARLRPDDALDAVGAVVLVADLSLPHASYYRPAIREKCFDGALPMAAPVAPTDLAAIELRTEIDCTLAQNRSLADWVRDPAQLLAEVTAFMTLNEGDVLLLGVSYQAPQAARGSRVRITAGALGELAFDIATGDAA